jgi:hypothetical protein
MEAGHQIDIRNVAYFRHQYDDEHADLRRLYEQAKRDQWNATMDIDWGQELDTDGELSFRRDLHAGLVRNLGKVGVLSDRVAPERTALGISLAAA